jgi:hypothetical protein
MNTALRDLVPILQLSIGPVILISGVGLLLLTLTNRFGRLVDRSRALTRELMHEPRPANAEALRQQIDILYRRAGILRLSIILGALTVLLVGILILGLFLSVLFKWESGVAIVILFSVGQIALIGSMVAFIREMNLSLAAVRLEIKN